MPNHPAPRRAQVRKTRPLLNIACEITALRAGKIFPRALASVRRCAAFLRKVASKWCKFNTPLPKGLSWHLAPDSIRSPGCQRCSKEARQKNFFDFPRSCAGPANHSLWEAKPKFGSQVEKRRQREAFPFAKQVYVWRRVGWMTAAKHGNSESIRGCVK